jgi:hypothetical protein
MKNIKSIFVLMVAVIGMSSCSPLFRTTNYCTTTENIYKLKKGMTLNEVTSALDVEPKDLYFNRNDGSKVVTYKYKVQYQKVPNWFKNREMYLRGNSDYFKSEGTLYVIFNSKDNKMIHYITDSGRKQSKKLLKNKQVLDMMD